MLSRNVASGAVAQWLCVRDRSTCKNYFALDCIVDEAFAIENSVKYAL